MNKNMKIKIEEFYSRLMFPCLIMGKPKAGMYEKAIIEISEKIKSDYLPIKNVSEVKWTQIVEKYDRKTNVLPYGTYGHLSIAKITIVKNFDRYSFLIIFNYVPEKEDFKKALVNAINKINFKEFALKWNIEDL